MSFEDMRRDSQHATKPVLGSSSHRENPMDFSLNSVLLMMMLRLIEN